MGKQIVWYSSEEGSSCDIIRDNLNCFGKDRYFKTRWNQPIPNGDIFIGSYRYFDSSSIYREIYDIFGENNLYIFAHGISKEESQNFKFFESNWQERAAKCKKILVSSKYTYNHFLQANIETDILPFGVNTKQFYQNSKDKDNGPLFGMAFAQGKGHRKGFEYALKAIRKKHICIIFSHHLHSEMIQFYNSIDCLIILSENDGRETFCLPILEAGACGIPVFSTPVGVTPEIIDNSCGFIGSKEEIIAMLSIITKEDLYDMGQKLYKKVIKDWRWDLIIKKWNEYFES